MSSLRSRQMAYDLESGSSLGRVDGAAVSISNSIARGATSITDMIKREEEAKKQESLKSQNTPVESLEEAAKVTKGLKWLKMLLTLLYIGGCVASILVYYLNDASNAYDFAITYPSEKSPAVGREFTDAFSFNPVIAVGVACGLWALGSLYELFMWKGSFLKNFAARSSITFWVAESVALPTLLAAVSTSMGGFDLFGLLLFFALTHVVVVLFGVQEMANTPSSVLRRGISTATWWFSMWIFVLAYVPTVIYMASLSNVDLPVVYWVAFAFSVVRSLAMYVWQWAFYSFNGNPSAGSLFFDEAKGPSSNYSRYLWGASIISTVCAVTVVTLMVVTSTLDDSWLHSASTLTVDLVAEINKLSPLAVPAFTDALVPITSVLPTWLDPSACACNITFKFDPVGQYLLNAIVQV